MSYQKCPLCKAKGTIKKETCPACSGEKILCKKTGLPPSKYVFPYITYPVYPNYPYYPLVTYIDGINTDNTVITLNTPYTLTDIMSQIN